MGVETINGAVVLPHTPNWKAGDVVKRSRVWRNATTMALAGNEDRMTSRVFPFRSITYPVMSLSVKDRARIAARISEAVKTKMAVVPYWSSPQPLEETLLPVPFQASGSVGNQYDYGPLEIGALYLYVRGQWDQEAFLTSSWETRERRYFVATNSSALVQVPHGAPLGRIYKVNYGSPKTLGLKTWAENDWVFFVREEVQDLEYRDLQREILVDCGSEVDVLPFKADGAFDPTQFTTLLSADPAVDTSEIVGFPPAPSGVYQTARELLTNNPALAIRYTFTGLISGIECRVRLHFAEIREGMDGTVARRVMNVTVRGAGVHTVYNVEPYRDAGNTMNKATVVDFLVPPDEDGVLVVEIKPKDLVQITTASTENVDIETVAVIDGVGLLPGVYVLLKDQADATENGIWVAKQGGGLERSINFTGRDIEQLTAIYVLFGSVNGGRLYRNTDAEVVLGTSEIHFEQVTSGIYYRAILNAIELYQYTWEVLQCQDGSSGQQLILEDWTRGYYGGNRAAAYEALFGVPTVSDMAAFSTKVGELDLTVTEPLPASSILGASACPVEICEEGHIDEETPIPEWNPDSEAPHVVCPVGGPQIFSSSFYWPAANNGIDPRLFLTLDQIAFHMALFANEWNDIKGELGGIATVAGYFWTFEGTKADRLAMYHKMTSGSIDPNDPTGNETDEMQGAYTLSLVYCLAP